MTESKPYDWALDDEDEASPPLRALKATSGQLVDWSPKGGRFAPPEEETVSQGMSSTLTALVDAHRQVALAEIAARDNLRSFLAVMNQGRRPEVGDRVIPWSLLREPAHTGYEVVGVVPVGQDLRFIVQLPPGSAGEFAVYGPSDIFLIQ